MSTTNTATNPATSETTTAKKTEWIAVCHGDNGTVKIAYSNPAALARGLAEQTSEGWMVARVYERERQTYAFLDE